MSKFQKMVLVLVTLTLTTSGCSGTDFSGSGKMKSERNDSNEGDPSSDNDIAGENNDGEGKDLEVGDDEIQKKFPAIDDVDEFSKSDTTTSDDGTLIMQRVFAKELEIAPIVTIMPIDTSGSMDKPVAAVQKQLPGLSAKFLNNERNGLIVIADKVENNFSMPAELIGKPNAIHQRRAVGSCNALLAALDVLEQGGVNPVSIGKNTVVHVVFVTDDDAGAGNCKGGPKTPEHMAGVDAAAYKTRVTKATNLPATIHYHGFLTLGGLAKCANNQIIGSQYLELIGDGIKHEVCDTAGDWSAPFSNLYEKITSSVKKEFNLVEIPKSESVSVRVNGTVLNKSDFVVIDKTLTLLIKLQADDRIVIIYRPEL